MKYSISILLFLVVVGCTQKPKAVTVEPEHWESDTDQFGNVSDHADTLKQIYHIKLELYAGQYYVLHYTTDNWETFENIYELNDESETWGHEAVGIKIKLMEYDEALNFARKFPTYQSVIDYGKALWNHVNERKKYRIREYFVIDSLNRLKTAPNIY